MTAREVTKFCAFFSARKSDNFLQILGWYPFLFTQKTWKKGKKHSLEKFIKKKKIQWRNFPVPCCGERALILKKVQNQKGKEGQGRIWNLGGNFGPEKKRFSPPAPKFLANTSQPLAPPPSARKPPPPSWDFQWKIVPPPLPATRTPLSAPASRNLGAAIPGHFLAVLGPKCRKFTVLYRKLL